MKARKTVLNLKVNVRYALIIFVFCLGLSCQLTDRNQTDGLINDSISESESKNVSPTPTLDINSKVDQTNNDKTHINYQGLPQIADIVDKARLGKNTGNPT